MKILNLITSADTLFPNKTVFTGSRDLIQASFVLPRPHSMKIAGGGLEELGEI